MGRFEGWRITGWAAVGLLLVTVVIFALGAWSQDAVRVWIRATARTSVTLFLMAFAASSLRHFWPAPATSWLLRNRRYVGVSFAISHALHLAALITLGVAFPEPFVEELDVVTVAGGGMAYVFIAAMTATSFDRTAAWLGPRRWKLLHRVGAWYVWLIFVQSYVPRALIESAAYAPVVLALLGVGALRLAAARRGAKRGRS